MGQRLNMTKAPSSLRIYSPRGQVILLLLYVLSQERYAEPKMMIVQRIRFWGLFDFAEEDRKPYPSKVEVGSDEERWVTLVAFARQDCVDRGWMKDIKPNKWQVTDAGRAVVEAFKKKCAEGKLDVQRGFLWTPKLKRVFSPEYQQSDKDEIRPKYSIYDDVKAAIHEEEFSVLLSLLREGLQKS